jgi:hypothetical protein
MGSNYRAQQPLENKWAANTYGRAAASRIKKMGSSYPSGSISAAALGEKNGKQLLKQQHNNSSMREKNGQQLTWEMEKTTKP